MEVSVRATPHTDVARRLLANVDAGMSDQSDVQMKIPVANYRGVNWKWKGSSDDHRSSSPFV
jgi:hypothetical protein